MSPRFASRRSFLRALGLLPSFDRLFGQKLGVKFTDVAVEAGLARARNVSPSEQQRLAAEFQTKVAEKQRQVLGPLLGKAQIAIASIESNV